MIKSLIKPELLAPAGDMEKLKAALHYGADAVYLSGERYGLRAAAGNFPIDAMAEGVRLAHKAGARAYLAMNIFAHNDDINNLYSYLKDIEQVGFDAIIASDPGVIELIKETLPDTSLHLSTQANMTNWRSVKFWKEQGVAKVCAARELSLDEIREIRETKEIPDRRDLQDQLGQQVRLELPELALPVSPEPLAFLVQRDPPGHRELDLLGFQV